VKQCRSQKLDGLRHGALDVDGLAVVPALLEEGNQEVQGHHDIHTELIVTHGGRSDGGGKAGNLLKLPLDGGTDVLDLAEEGLVVGDDLGEHLDSVKNRSDDDWHLLEDGVRSDQEGVLLGPALDQLFLLVELLEVLKINNIDINAELGNLVLVFLIGDNADLEVGARVVGETHGTDESLVLLGVVVLKTNLKLDSLSKLALLHDLSELGDTFADGLVVNLGGHTYLSSK